MPKACEIKPTVPILKKPKLQKIIDIIAVAMLVAAKNFSLLKWPINPISTNPTRGTAKFEKKTGRDNVNKYFLVIIAGYFILMIKALIYTVLTYNKII